MLLQEMEPDQGRVKVRKEMEFSYFDQKRSDLDPTDSLKKTLSPGGGDYIDVMGKQRHVCGYLKDFMFDPSRVQDKVSQLSGGQKNRLMLAKILANPKTCLILDEPTNDLDVETLDLLQDLLGQYDGTVLLVSHDRDFLDRVAVTTIAMEGDGKAVAYAGGWSDYQQQKGSNQSSETIAKNKLFAPETKTKTKTKVKSRPKQNLSFSEQHRLETLPAEISKFESQISKLEDLLSDPDLFNAQPVKFKKATEALFERQEMLLLAEHEWLELEEKSGV